MENKSRNLVAYVAGAYTAPTKEQQLGNYSRKLIFTAALTRAFHNVTFYSPIIHFHHIAELAELPTNMLYWRKHNITMLDCADLLVVMDEGDKTKNSQGTQFEIAYFRDTKMKMEQQLLYLTSALGKEDIERFAAASEYVWQKKESSL